MIDWFVIRRAARRQAAERLVQRRGFGAVAEELYRDIAASDATGCTVNIALHPDRPVAELVVTDDASGRFRDLHHARAAFAEKHLLAFCREATVHTTKGTVVFDGRGADELPRRRTNRGTMLRAVFDCTPERYEQFVQYTRRLAPKPGLRVFINGEEVGVETGGTT